MLYKLAKWLTFTTFIYESHEITSGWDGRIKGVDADMDSYYFIMIYKCTHSKEKIMRKGDVLLLR